jgi:hypothetical protein
VRELHEISVSLREAESEIRFHGVAEDGVPGQAPMLLSPGV